MGKFIQGDYVQAIRSGVLAKILDKKNGIYIVEFMGNNWGRQSYIVKDFDEHWDISYPENVKQISKIVCDCGASKTYGEKAPMSFHYDFCSVRKI